MRIDLQNDYQKNLERERGRRQSLKIWISGLFVLVVMLVSAGGWYILSGKHAQRRYEEYVDAGNRYLIQLDYDSAEIAFKKAIEEIPDQADAYEKLVNVYLVQNRYEEAGDLLATGIRYTNADALVKTYQRVSAILKEQQDDGMNAENMSAEELQRISEYITLDPTIYDIVASYTYRDYVRAYGEPVSAADNIYGGRDFQFDKFLGKVSFRTASYEADKADTVSFESMSELFGNYGGAASAEKMQELFGSEKLVTNSESEDGSTQYHVSFTYHGCLITLASDEKGNVYGNTENVLSPAPPETEDESGEEDIRGQRSASGYIINAVNGGGVTAAVRFLHGGRYGTAERETSTKSDGSFEAKLKPGQYTVEIHATGFITSYEEIIVSTNSDLKGLNFTLSPDLEVGEIRIVLTWEETPRDLDSHLEGTSSDGERVDVDFTDKIAENTAELDIDDTSGFGPETTTIYDIGGSYTFSVHNFSEDDELEDSGAVVRIYLADQAEPVIFEVPSGDGIWWNVCTIEEGQIVPVNAISQEP